MNVAKGTIKSILENATLNTNRYALWQGIVYMGKKYNGHLDSDPEKRETTLVLHPAEEIIYALKRTKGQKELKEMY